MTGSPAIRFALAAIIAGFVLAAFLGFFLVFVLAPLAIFAVFYALYVLREALGHRHGSRADERKHREAEARRREIERERGVRPRLGAP